MATREYRSSVRARHAEDTRRTIVDAAAALFAEQGYARTSVAAVAAAAGVALNTVYTSVGGKSALIMALTDDGAGDPTAIETVSRIAESADPAEILLLTAKGTARVRRARWQVLGILLDNRTSDPDVAAAADAATRVVRDRLDLVAARLVEVGGLRPGLDVDRVGQVLWFYFGFEAWRTARGLGWGWDEAAEWLATQAAGALLDR
ncbi:TetR/AcrR family transcriptional regulator [Umezawaea endophytica]|uniref:TetR/AcrR family transcriptional regulator n=1 Tax=Umezawaea endophytica TaxID=1654476 RepID=A0A9X2VIQ0_9PSEU|nr:TetR/AcrR family transcriptional regulator [Umezawaea endophytica]MCS7477281.1 TetR/AcrR family transcriptional regulator [Umezawaea endophytica]